MANPGALINCVWRRCISSTAVCHGKRNFRKFQILNKRGSRIYKEARAARGEHDMRAVHRPYLIDYDGQHVYIPEIQPQLIVPDLTDTELRPYVSYRAPDVIQSEFTPQQLFDAVYSEKITKDLKAGKLNEEGEPLEPSAEEKLTRDEAWNNARKTGSDIFS